MARKINLSQMKQVIRQKNFKNQFKTQPKIKLIKLRNKMIKLKVMSLKQIKITINKLKDQETTLEGKEILDWIIKHH